MDPGVWDWVGPDPYYPMKDELVIWACALLVPVFAAITPPKEPTDEWVPVAPLEAIIEQEHRFEVQTPDGEPLIIVDERGNVGLIPPVESVVFDPLHPPEGLSLRCRESLRILSLGRVPPRVVVCLETSELADKLFHNEAP